MERTQFTFYDSFRKAIARIKKKSDRADVYDAICDYALYGTEPDLENISDAAAIAFELIRPNLDSSRRKAAGGANGKPTKDDGKIVERCDKDAANKKKDKKEGEKEKEGEIEREKEYECTPQSPSRFTPPTYDHVKLYCMERCNNVDAQRFVDFYASKGWMVGKAKMKDWKAAVRNWEKEDKAKPKETHINPFMREDVHL
jgi:hypothetical protein